MDHRFINFTWRAQALLNGVARGFRRIPILALIVSVSLLSLGAARAPREVDWAALNPAYAGSEFVGDSQVCLGCHEDSAEKYQHTAHARAFSENARTALERLDCESCHGPMGKHVDDPTDEFSLDRMTPEGRSQTCLQCHSASKERMQWHGSAHSASGVSCDSCHVVMERRSDSALLATADEQTTCYSCHADTRAAMNKASHHPVREGKMSCSSCHNPHGSVGPKMVRRASVSETCQSCHQDKAGPFLWEHPPVRESCATCHDPHGSNNRSMLEAKAHFVCLTCHSYGGHINLPRYNRTSTPTQQGCINCHVTPHGSNHPSGAKLTR